MRIKNTDIFMIRGDSEPIKVIYCQKNGTIVPFVEGDTVYFTVKTSIEATEKILQKVVTDFDNGVAIISLLPDDTKNLKAKAYCYDVRVTKANGEKKTIILPSKLTLEAGVNDE